MEKQRPTAPGLRWRKRANGPDVPVWICEKKFRKDGYPIAYVRLGHLANNPEALIARCVRLDFEMRTWKNPLPFVFDGTFASLLGVYQVDPESEYHNLKPSALKPYAHYIPKLMAHIGTLRIDGCDGRDVKKWFRVWAGVEDLRDPAAMLPKANMILAILKAAVSFGIVCKKPGCRSFKAILDELEFPKSKRREYAPTAEQITAIRAAARAAGAPSRALCYALQFETTARQWDLIGEWLPLSDPRPSAMIDHRKKWIGPTWANVDEKLILRITPTKTEGTTDARGTYDLTVCPMVMEELASIPPDRRVGPLIVNPNTGLPYVYSTFAGAWREDFDAAGLPPKMWGRDLRAGGSTEASAAGASRDDRAKVAAHSPETQGQVYDRSVLEAHRRVMTARKGFRAGNT